VKDEYEIDGQVVVDEDSDELCCGCGYIAKEYAVCVDCKGKRHRSCGDDKACRNCVAKKDTEAMVGFFARAQERAMKLVQDKYTYKRKAEDSVARVEVLEMELAAERNESKKLKDNCAKLEKSFEEAVDALEGLVAVVKGL
jgi:hypothetical protein